jgi:hypothetical protein
MVQKAYNTCRILVKMRGIRETLAKLREGSTGHTGAPSSDFEPSPGDLPDVISGFIQVPAGRRSMGLQLTVRARVGS